MSFNRTQSANADRHAPSNNTAPAYTDHFITVADALRQQAVDADLGPAEKFTTVYSGIRTEWFDPARFDGKDIRRRWGFTPDDVVVCKIARMFPGKGYEYFIPAMTDAAHRDPRRDSPHRDGQNRRLYEQQIASAACATDRFSGSSCRTKSRPLAGVDMSSSVRMGRPSPHVRPGLLMERPVSFDIDGAPRS